MLSSYKAYAGAAKNTYRIVDPHNLKTSNWWTPWQILGVSFSRYLKLARESGAKIEILKLDSSRFPHHYILLPSWDTEDAAHQFALYINRIARSKNFDPSLVTIDYDFCNSAIEKHLGGVL